MDREASRPGLSIHFDARDREPPHVRPLGCHPERPVLRRIGDRNLFLGNRFAADPQARDAATDSPACDGRADREFDAVLTVASEPAPATTHHRPLVDGPEAEWARFRSAVDTARRLHGEDGSLLVHCKAGISRSTTVVATTIASEETRPLPEAFDAVRAARPHAVAHPWLRELAVYYVAALGDRPPKTE